MVGCWHLMGFGFTLLHFEAFRFWHLDFKHMGQSFLISSVWLHACGVSLFGCSFLASRFWSWAFRFKSWILRLWIFAFGLDLLFLGFPARPHPHFLIVPLSYIEAFAFGERDSPMSCAACGHSGCGYQLWFINFLVLVLVLALVLFPLLEFSNFWSLILSFDRLLWHFDPLILML